MQAFCYIHIACNTADAVEQWLPGPGCLQDAQYIPSSSTRAFQRAQFAQPGPRELPFHGMTAPDSSPGLAPHTVISSNSGASDSRSSVRISPNAVLHICRAPCLPTALLSCGPPRLPCALTHHCFLPFPHSVISSCLQLLACGTELAPPRPAGSTEPPRP